MTPKYQSDALKLSGSKNISKMSMIDGLMAMWNTALRVSCKKIRLQYCNRLVLGDSIHPHTTKNNDVPVRKKFIFLDVPYVRKPSCRFYKNISRLIFKVSDVQVTPIY